MMKTFTFPASAPPSRRRRGRRIVGIAGFEDVDIGETICDSEEREPVPFVAHRSAHHPDAVCRQRRPPGRPRGQARHLPPHPRTPDARNRDQHLDPSGGHRTAATSSPSAPAAQCRSPSWSKQMRREGYEVCVSRPEVIYRGDETARSRNPTKPSGWRPRTITSGDCSRTSPAARDRSPHGPPRRTAAVRGHHPDPRPDRLRRPTGQPDHRPRHHEPHVQGIRPRMPARSGPATPARWSRWKPASPPPTRSTRLRSAAGCSSAPATRSMRA